MSHCQPTEIVTTTTAKWARNIFFSFQRKSEEDRKPKSLGFFDCRKWIPPTPPQTPSHTHISPPSLPALLPPYYPVNIVAPVTPRDDSFLNFFHATVNWVGSNQAGLGQEMRLTLSKSLLYSERVEDFSSTSSCLALSVTSVWWSAVHACLLTALSPSVQWTEGVKCVRSCKNLPQIPLKLKS